MNTSATSCSPPGHSCGLGSERERFAVVPFYQTRRYRRLSWDKPRLLERWRCSSVMQQPVPSLAAPVTIRLNRVAGLQASSRCRRGPEVSEFRSSFNRGTLLRERWLRLDDLAPQAVRGVPQSGPVKVHEQMACRARDCFAKRDSSPRSVLVTGTSNGFGLVTTI